MSIQKYSRLAAALCATVTGFTACGGGGGAGESADASRSFALDVKADTPVKPPDPVAFPPPATPHLQPDDDPFYAQPDAATLQTYPPGAVIRYREITARMYWVLPTFSKAWQVIYRTNDSHGQAVATGAAVVVPPNAPKTGRKLLAYQPASDALTRRCAPSFGALEGTLLEAVFLAPTIAASGWVTVLSDYEGPDSQWMAGRMSGQGVLDGIRAAENFQPAGLDGAATPALMWGYSGGGYATAWAAELQTEYAPELKILGAAVGGAPASVETTARNLDGTLLTGIVFAAALGLNRAFPEMEVDRQLTEKGRKMKEDFGKMCLAQELTRAPDPLFAGYHFHRMDDYTTTPGVLNQPQVKAVLDLNRLGYRKPVTPVYYYQGILDEITPIAVADGVVKRYCDMGASVKYDRVFGEHVSTLIGNANTAFNFLKNRADGLPAPSSCPPGA